MIDILPVQQKVLIRRIRFMRMCTTIVSAIVVLAVIAGLLLLPTLETIRSRKIALQAYTKQLEEEGMIVSAEDITNLQSRTTALSARLAVPLPESPLSYIGIVKTHQISGIRLVGYEILNPEKRTLQIRGVATTRQILQQFISALQEDARIATVDSPVTNFVKSTESEFTMTITFTQL
jgi:hypothetical protein